MYFYGEQNKFLRRGHNVAKGGTQKNFCAQIVPTLNKSPRTPLVLGYHITDYNIQGYHDIRVYIVAYDCNTFFLVYKLYLSSKFKHLIKTRIIQGLCTLFRVTTYRMKLEIQMYGVQCTYNVQKVLTFQCNYGHKHGFRNDFRNALC